MNFRIAILSVVLMASCGTGGGGNSYPTYYADTASWDAALDRDGVGDDLLRRVDTSTGFLGLLDLAQEFPPGQVGMDALVTDGGSSPLCQGDNDGELTINELTALMGAVASFTQSLPGTSVNVPDPAGIWDDSCDCTRWDFSGDTPGDGLVYDGVLEPQGFWFADLIPGGDFVQSFEGGILGVYSLKTDGLYLVGLASEQEGLTALKYAPPVRLLALPMSLGDSWSTTASQAEGLYEGETYPLDTGFTGILSVEHSFYGKAYRKGYLTVPAGEFPVWRVLVDVTMEVRNSLSLVPVYASHRKIALFMAECTGLVARLRSQEDELSDFFTSATEYRRLGYFNEAAQ